METLQLLLAVAAIICLLRAMQIALKYLAGKQQKNFAVWLIIGLVIAMIYVAINILKTF